MVATQTSGYKPSLFKIGFKTALTLFLLTSCSEAVSGSWMFVPRALTSVSYVDNINLAPSKDAESSNVFELTPGFKLTSEGKRLSAKVDYHLQSLYYSNNPLNGGGQDSKYFNHLTATLGSELLKHLLFIDASAAVSQESSSAIGKGTLDNYTVSKDRGTVKKIILSPYLHHKVADGLDTELRYRYATINGDKDILVDNSIVRTYSLLMDSGRTLGKWKWRLDASNSKVDYQTKSDLSHYSAGLALSYHLFPRTILSLHGGTDKIEYQPSTTGETGGDYWLIGLDWVPTRRTSISLQAGKRFYGDSYGFSFRHTKRKSELGIDYKEAITDSSSIHLESQYIPVGTAINSEGVLVPLYNIQAYPVLTTEVLLRKMLMGHAIWQSGKTTLSVILSKIRYEYQTSNFDEIIQSGEISWNWLIHKNYSINFIGYYRNRKLTPANSTEKLGQVELKLAHNLTKNANMGISVVRTERNTDLTTLDYSQRRVTLSLDMKW